MRLGRKCGTRQTKGKRVDGMVLPLWIDEEEEMGSPMLGKHSPRGNLCDFPQPQRLAVLRRNDKTRLPLEEVRASFLLHVPKRILVTTEVGQVGTYSDSHQCPVPIAIAQPSCFPLFLCRRFFPFPNSFPPATRALPPFCAGSSSPFGTVPWSQSPKASLAVAQLPLPWQCSA
jgi:hypothetical protein